MNEKDQAAAQFSIHAQQVETGRQRVLREAGAAVLKDRNKAYGDPENNFKDIADVWNWWFSERLRDHEQKTRRLDIPTRFAITPLDVAYMMSLMKLARNKTNPYHMDSVVDNAGYAACAGDFVQKHVRTESAAMAQNISQGIAKAQESVRSGMEFAAHALGSGADSAELEKQADKIVLTRTGITETARWIYDPKYWCTDRFNNLSALQPNSWHPEHQPKKL